MIFAGQAGRLRYVLQASRLQDANSGNLIIIGVINKHEDKKDSKPGIPGVLSEAGV